MKKYYIVHERDFDNIYSLYYTEGEEMEAALPEDAERITRREAIHYCTAERYRRKHDPAFAYMADAYIHPTLGYDPCSSKDRETADGYVVLPNV